MATFASSRKPAKRPAALEPPPDTGDAGGGQAALRVEDLCPRLAADDRLQLAHHRRVRMRAGHRADEVVGVADVGHPVAQRLVHGVLERARALVDGVHGRAEEAHAEDVERLPLDVLGAHVDLAAEAEQRGDGGGGDAVLSGAGLGDEPPLPMRRARSAWPMQLLILCAPVWLRSSRLR
jgi:hypothetical protein